MNWVWLETPLGLGRLGRITPFFLIELVLVPLVCYFLGKFAERSWLKRAEPVGQLDRGVAYALGKLTFYTILFIGVFAVIADSGVNLTSLAAFAGAVGVGIGLGLQGIAKNFISGLILIFGRSVRPGDRIEVMQSAGDVLSIGLNSTTLRSPEDAILMIPNSQLLEQPLTNWTLRDKQRLVSTNVSVAYHSDPERVKEMLEEIALTVEGVLAEPKPNARLIAISANTLDFRLVVWTSDYVLVPQKLVSGLNLAIYRRFNQDGIELPLPTQVVRNVSTGPADPSNS